MSISSIITLILYLIPSFLSSHHKPLLSLFVFHFWVLLYCSISAVSISSQYSFFFLYFVIFCMCWNPLSPSMASPVPNPNPNPKSKRLNPHAIPFIKSLSPAKTELVLPFIPCVLSQPVSQPMPLSAQGVVSYSDLLSMPAWEYPAPATVVYYNTYKQPLPVNSMPFYVELADKESVKYPMNTQPVVGNLQPFYIGRDYEKGFDAMRDSAVLGCRRKGEENRHSLRPLPTRFRSKKRGKRDLSGERLWVPKKFSLSRKNNSAISPPTEIELDGKTSVMIKNIPNQFLRGDLLRIVDKHCLEENRKAKLRSDPFKSEYDFLYLPMDFRNLANLGYAFVNFTNTIAASRFFKAFNKYEWEVSVNKKTCEISCAVIQGKEAFKNHFKNSVFYCHTDGYLPVILSPPRDGLIHSRPVIVGRRRVGPAPESRGAPN